MNINDCNEYIIHMDVFNIGFIDSNGVTSEVQLDIEKHDFMSDTMVELFNLILSLREEMDINEIIYIEEVE